MFVVGSLSLDGCSVACASGSCLLVAPLGAGQRGGLVPAAGSVQCRALYSVHLLGGSNVGARGVVLFARLQAMQ